MTSSGLSHRKVDGESYRDGIAIDYWSPVVRLYASLFESLHVY